MRTMVMGEVRTMLIKIVGLFVVLYGFYYLFHPG